MKIRSRRVLLLAALVLSAACRSEPPPAAKLSPQTITGWREIASWNGRGNAQLDSFSIESSDWHIRWETKNESPAGSGTLRVESHSADSGRLMAVPVDVRGTGRDAASVSDLPHRYYLVVDSKNVDWSLIVEEAQLSP